MKPLLFSIFLIGLLSACQTTEIPEKRLPNILTSATPRALGKGDIFESYGAGTDQEIEYQREPAYQ